MTYIDREKFTTETGKNLYDILVKIAPHEDWVFGMLMLARGDDQRQELIDYINSAQRTIKDISRFVIEKYANTK